METLGNSFGVTEESFGSGKNIWHEINPKRITPDDFIAVIEIPKGCKNKYELDKDTGF